jgi:metallophosphoesterase superfamily enzyme
MSKDQLHELVNRLPESEVTPAARYLEFLIAHEEQPVAPEMLARIDAARAHPSAGIPHEEILREFGV